MGREKRCTVELGGRGGRDADREGRERGREEGAKENKVDISGRGREKLKSEDFPGTERNVQRRDKKQWDARRICAR